MGGSNKVVERQQMYSHTGTGLQKASHERMLNDQGRKVVKEKLGNQLNSYDHYKNLREEDAPTFDQQWNQMANQLGFRSNAMSNALGYGGENYMNRGAGRNYYADRGLGYEDDSRRGYYVPDETRAEY